MPPTTTPATVTLDDIQAARRADQRTSSTTAPARTRCSLSRLCGCEIYCKLDHLQMTGVVQGARARNKLLLLDRDEQRQRRRSPRRPGIMRLALAYHGQDLGIPVHGRHAQVGAAGEGRATAASFGADVILARRELRRRQACTRCDWRTRSRLTYVPGFDDPDIIAGQGTMGLEILEDVPDVDAVDRPRRRRRADRGHRRRRSSRCGRRSRIIGVEPSNAPTLQASLKAGKVTRIDTKPTLADGLAVAEVGQALLRHRPPASMDDLVMVDEAQIAAVGAAAAGAGEDGGRRRRRRAAGGGDAAVAEPGGEEGRAVPVRRQHRRDADQPDHRARPRRRRPALPRPRLPQRPPRLARPSADRRSPPPGRA